MTDFPEKRAPRGIGSPTTRVTIVAVAMVLLAGCTQMPAQEPHPDESTKGPIVKSAQRGPVKMTVSTDKGEISLADRLKLTIEVTAENGVDVQMPTLGDDMQMFAVRDIHDEPAQPVEGGRRWRQQYDLDVFVSGDYEIPALTAHFTDHRQSDQDAVESSVSTEPFTIKVASLVEGDFDPTKFRDVKGPVAIPIPRTWAWAWWTGGGLAAMSLLALSAVWLIRRLRREPPEIIIPAHEWAYDQLQRLIDQQLVEQGLVNEFYFQLSMIVRRYIERRFNLHAPEWTTEEFLVNVQRSDAWPIEHRASLGEFLQACDMVKFARYQPKSAEIEQAFNAARDFVVQTADTNPQPERVAA